jgi:hypothetical protein
MIAISPDNPTHRVYRVESRDDVDVITTTDRLVAGRTIGSPLVTAGGHYEMVAGQFHATVASSAITVALSRKQPDGVDLSLGPIEGTSHSVRRHAYDSVETIRLARRIVLDVSM